MSCCADEGCGDNKKPGDLTTIELDEDDDITSEEEI